LGKGNGAIAFSHLHLKWLEDELDLGVVHQDALAQAICHGLDQDIPLDIAKRISRPLVPPIVVQ
jgi:hypothetical protein